MNLTKRQKEILDFIRSYRAEHGISPTQREIREKFHLSSFGTVQKHLKRLEEKGAEEQIKNEQDQDCRHSLKEQFAKLVNNCLHLACVA